MRRHSLGTLVGLCMLGLAAPTWAVPMTETLFGEVTEIVDPAFALDFVVGTPATIVAKWDTDDFVDTGPILLPGFFAISLADNPDSSVTITVGSHTWIATDDVLFGMGDFAIGNFPFLLFDADGDFLGLEFRGNNGDGNAFQMFAAADLFDRNAPARFSRVLVRRSSSRTTVAIRLESPVCSKYQGLTASRCPSPARSRCSVSACSVSA